MKEESKNKEVSLLLAVFLSLWTWLYTAEKDWWKFVVSFVVGIARAVLHVKTDLIPLVMLPAINIALWIWAIVDVAIKKNEWYRSYFKRQPLKAGNGTLVITGEAIFCPRCGMTALDGRDYCWNCGKSTIESDDYCRRCGVSLMDTPVCKVLQALW
jgi:hypothetical protein